ncbi:hypothetical protein P152DRAFT_480315 [Eremomyces bilateralis CBS 781.70]|uniref:Nucleoporin NUP188 n=1 Tax=Eremomyces bilateralis CBS 781.70 TaxID=1392243 RepID=A0A6G1GBE4_9PEZI|nr:uncharacterized protein P152DRAFT_480315 [Eremomyces bilateralis CBS 781.70]KAF1815256.1 hypothetical protein P152DRAFT_480315 [Eremomyces bilateralis CBS 781.70]
MEPENVEVYFPPLNKCLTGGAQLLSWKSVYWALTCSGNPLEDTPVQSFLNDPVTYGLLRHAFEPTMRMERGPFDTKTSAVNVTPGDNALYNIEEIKEDAIWLSEELKIDELAALRLVILEWQGRPQSKLLCGFTEEEVLGIQNAIGAINSASSLISQEEQNNESISKERRKVNLLRLYMTERAHLTKVTEFLLHYGVSTIPLQRDFFGYRDPKSATGTDEWIATLGQRLLGNLHEEGFTHVRMSRFTATCKTWLEVRHHNLDAGQGWLKRWVENGAVELAETWAWLQLSEMVAIMQILLVHLIAWRDICSITMVETWFDFLGSASFFDGAHFRGPFESTASLVYQLQLLVSSTSVLMIWGEGIRPYLVEHARDRSSEIINKDQTRFIASATCMESVHRVIVNASNAGLQPAIPAIYAWSLIGLLVKDAAAEAQEQGLQQSPSQPLDTADPGQGFYETVAELLSTVQNPRDDAEEDDQIALLLVASIDQFQILNVISGIADGLDVMVPQSSGTATRLALRRSLLSLVRDSLTYVQYSADLLGATLSILSSDKPVHSLVSLLTREIPLDAREANRVKDASDFKIITEFLEDQRGFMRAIFDQAVLRFPLEVSPLLKLCQALAVTPCPDNDPPGALWVRGILSQLHSFTCRLPANFAGYEIIPLRDGVNGMRLLYDLPLFTEVRRTLLHSNQNGASGTPFIMNAGTVGALLTSKPPHITSWEYSCSAFELLTSYLSTLLGNCNERPTFADHELQLDTAADIISTITILLDACFRMPHIHNQEDVDPKTEALLILGECRSLLSDQRDLISVVFAIFEQQLQRECEQPGLDGSLDLLISCLRFITIVTAVSPERVWGPLSRSRFVRSDGSGGAIIAIVTSTELVTGQFGFLLACIRLFEELVEDAVIRSVSRNAASKAVVRFGTPNVTTSMSTQKMISDLIALAVKLLAGVYSAFGSWNFQDVNERLEIGSRLTSLFERIVVYVYDCDEATAPKERLAGTLAGSAEYLLEIFLAPSDSSGFTRPLLESLTYGCMVPSQTPDVTALKPWTKQTESAIKFSTILLRAGILLNMPTSLLEQQLFKVAPVLARLFAGGDAHKYSTACLLEAMIRSSDKSSEEPASLLGQMGSETATSFLAALLQLNRPLEDPAIEEAIWQLLSAVVSSRQQWFAIAILTGKSPRDMRANASRGGQQASLGNNVLRHAAEALKADEMPIHRGFPMLTFLRDAFSHYAWTMDTFTAHRDCVNALIRHLQPMPRPSSLNTPEVVVTTAQQWSFISVAVEILALHLHSEPRQKRADLVARLTQPSADRPSVVEYLTGPVPGMSEVVRAQVGAGASPIAYNRSLHANLNRNFNMVFRPASLQNFKRTLLYRAELGWNYFYDIPFAAKLLRYEKAWEGRNGNGLKAEVLRANANLSLVESQVQLLRAWKLLAIELSRSITPNERAARQLTTAVVSSLEANKSDNSPPELAGRVIQSRLELSFIVVQRLVAAGLSDQETQELFDAAWNAFRDTCNDFDNAFSGSNVDEVRMTLKILFLAIQANFRLLTQPRPDGMSDGDWNQVVQRRTAQIPTALEIMDKVVLRGVKSFVKQVHNDAQSCDPSDLVLLTAIFQFSLRVPGMGRSHSQISLLVSTASAIRCATTLFSWSDKLVINGDPIYGELSVLFLLELSSVPLVAESMAVEGVLANISNSNLAKYFRLEHGMGPFDEPVRLHSIWTRGILPLCLNLLDSVGPPIAAELATFLNQFRGQLARNVTTIDSKQSRILKTRPGTMTLNLASETHSLALLAALLDRCRSAGLVQGVVAADIPALDWDRATVRDDVESWLASRAYLRQRIVPASEGDVGLAKMAAIKGENGSENRLEERVVQELQQAMVLLAESANGGG